MEEQQQQSSPAPENKKNNMATTAVIVMAVVIGLLVVTNRRKTAPAPLPPESGQQTTGTMEQAADRITETLQQVQGTTTTDTTVDQPPAAGTVKEFTVTGKKFAFTPSEITVNKGDQVKITFNNEEGLHNYVIDEFNVSTKQIQAGESDTVTFTADKTGTFEYYCAVANHRAQGMVGKLIVQ